MGKRPRVLLSTGLGRLHFVPAAESLASSGIDIEVVQGWVPRLVPGKFINLLGAIVGSPHLADGMSKRRMPFLHRSRMHECSLAEFWGQGLFAAHRLGLLERGAAASRGWKAFGTQTRRFIGGQDIFHVRAGAGRGGAIAEARQRKLKVVVDFSIAHPAFMEVMLRPEFERAGLPFWINSSDSFWKMVLQDAEDADLLLVNSDFVKKTFVDRGYRADRIAVAYLGVRSDFAGLKTNYEVGPRLELLFTGGFGIRKGAQYLLPALEDLAKRGLDFRLTVVGDAAEARALLAASKLADRLNCVGFLPQDQLKEYLSKSDIYVFPSLAEGCASSGMEAMAAGLPVIATKESGLPIEDRSDGLLIKSKSTEAIVAAICELASDAGLRNRLGQAATKKIANRYSWGSYAVTVRQAYLSILGQGETQWV